MMTKSKIKVYCRSSTTYAERPIAFVWQGVRQDVKIIAAEWRTPDEKHYRIETTDEQIFELIYGEKNDEWWILQP